MLNCTPSVMEKNSKGNCVSKFRRLDKGNTSVNIFFKNKSIGLPTFEMSKDQDRKMIPTLSRLKNPENGDSGGGEKKN